MIAPRSISYARNSSPLVPPVTYCATVSDRLMSATLMNNSMRCREEYERADGLTA